LLIGDGPRLVATLRDVKNEDRPDYVYENKGSDDKMAAEKHVIYQRNTANEACLTRTKRAY
jgi:hypothetical protein